MDTQEPNTSMTPTPVTNHLNIKLPSKINFGLKKFADYVFSNLTVISIGFFIILAIGLVAFFYYQNQRLKQMLSQRIPSPTPYVLEDPLASWRVYKSVTDSYQFKVPKEWEEIKSLEDTPNKVVFQSSDGLYRFTADFMVNKNKATEKAYSSLDEFIGLPYAVKALKVSGLEARQPLPKAGFENYNKVYFFSQNGSLIYSLELLVGDGTKTDHRVTFESLEIGADIFDKILSTFKFFPIPSGTPSPTFSTTRDLSVPSPSAKVCTQEAKVCPDGSSVGRTGPNCAFAPCPTQ